MPAVKTGTTRGASGPILAEAAQGATAGFALNSRIRPA